MTLSRASCHALALISCLLTALVAPSASAQLEDPTAATFVPDEAGIIPEGQARQDGWHPALTLGANLNLASNSNVVGQVDGFSLLVGVSVIGELRLISGAHDWANSLALNETWAKTPVLDEFVKSHDSLEAESLYRYFAWVWGGPYARLSLQMPLFAAQQATVDPQTYVLEGEDPATDGVTTDRFAIADPFSPLTVTESIGLFADPVTDPHLNVSVRAGFGGRHTLADGARQITNADDPTAVTFVELLDVHQAGLELFAGLKGKAADDRLSYDAGLAVLVPFLNNDDSGRDALDLTRVAFAAGLTTNIFTWMALNYQLRVVDDPHLFDKVQIHNSLLLTFSYTFSEAPPPPPEPAPLDPALLEAAEERARVAEERAQVAEERAKRAEEQGVPAPVVSAPETEPPPPATVGGVPDAAQPASAPQPAPQSTPTPTPAP